MRGTVCANEREQPDDHVPPPRSENTLHHDQSGQPLDVAAHPTRPHYTCSKTNETSSILSTPRPGPMNPPTFQRGANHLGGIQVRPTSASEEQARSRSPLLTRALPIKRKRFLASMKGNQHETSSPTLPLNPHTRSKIIPL